MEFDYKISRIVGDWAAIDNNAAQILADNPNGINLRSYLDEYNDHYILKNERPVRAGLFDSVESMGRQIDHTMVGDVKVSTVFLSFDHGRMFDDSVHRHEPTLFETMIFGGTHNDYQQRYTSYQAARQGHLVAVEMVENVDGR